MEPRILLVEDERHLARGLSFNFRAEGYAVEVAESGEEALRRLEGRGGLGFQLLVLDVMLKGISGLDVLAWVRDRELPAAVLLLTARDGEQDIVRGLDMGADDYLTKPFSLPVLLARVRTLLRRAHRGDESAGAEGEAALPASFAIGEATVLADRFELQRGDELRMLTAKELGLLQLLYARRGSAVSRGDILREVWNLHPETRTRVVDTFVSRLRKLIEPDPARPRFLLSVRSYGYRLEP